MLTVEDVRSAARRLYGVAHRTPVVTCRALDDIAGARLFLKCENFQRGGAFKFRGAYNAISQLTNGERKHGLIAFSSGNHAQGVALAAQLLGAKATIVMPEDAPRLKIDATKGYGANVIFYDRLAADREAIARQVQEETNGIVIAPFDDYAVMAGQGTTALELLEEAPDLDVLLAPLGGGGLMSGCATIARDMRPGIKLYGIEPEAGDDWARSWRRGERVTIEPPDTIADGLRAPTPGKLTWPIVRSLAHGVLTVSDAEIRRAMRLCIERAKIVVEPSGAAALAAALAGKIDLHGKRVGIVISGGNVDPDTLADLLRA